LFSQKVFPLWAAEDLANLSNDLKYTKCCARYRQPFTCDGYVQSNIDFCKSFTTELQCVHQGSGFSRQALYGFGRFLFEMRRECVRDEYACGVFASNEWAPRDRCIWCGTDCRPGSDFGICNGANPRAAPLVQQFAGQFSRFCSPQQACSLSQSYPDLYSVLVDPYTLSAPEDEGGNGTPSPTRPINCRSLKTPRECSQYYDNCVWSNWYGFQVCRDLDLPKNRKSKPGAGTVRAGSSNGNHHHDNNNKKKPSPKSKHSRGLDVVENTV
jgi:hypothetical protein